jgi:microcystin-dependent protein
VCPGQLANGNLYDLGEQGGSERVTLLTTEIPSHNHTVNATTVKGTLSDPQNNLLSEGQYSNQTSSGALAYYTAATSPQVTMNPNMIAPAGSSLPHNNMMPYLTLNFCIALQGVYPPRT